VLPVPLDPLELPEPPVLPDPELPLPDPEPLEPVLPELLPLVPPELSDPPELPDPEPPVFVEPLEALVPDVDDWLALPPHAVMANAMAATSDPWRTNDIFIT
jgi:hypothetical protein